MSWWPEIPFWEVIVRSLVVFFVLLTVLRLSGKRDVGEMSHADLLLLLLISANVHTSMAGDDKSILGGIFGAIALITANYALNFISFRSKKFERVLKGHPEVIIHNGKPVEKIMRRHRLSEMQLKMAIRKEQAENFEEVRLAVLEPDGEIAVFKYEDDRPERHRGEPSMGHPLVTDNGL